MNAPSSPGRDATPPDGVPASRRTCPSEAIAHHLTRYVGKSDTVWREIASDPLPIDLHTIAPTAQRPYYTLVTAGMSSREMKVPPGAEERRFAELMICLPADWPLKDGDWNDESRFWPIRTLKSLARYPHEHHTWLGWGHTVPNGTPAQPFSAHTQLSSVILTHPRTVPPEFWSLPVSAGRTIHFYAVVPLYPDELQFKLTRGARALVSRLEHEKVTELVDPARPMVLPRAWWQRF